MSGEDRVQVDILGLSTNPASGGAYALILKEVNGPRRLPIIIGAFEAQSIALEIENIKPPRPLTHDLMKTLIEALGGDLIDVTITELREGTFYARLNLDTQEIDSRPSDAIALAVRFGAPIYVAEKVMEEASFVPENDEDIQSQQPPKQASEESLKTPLSKLEQLQKSLDEAIAKEDYERAAQIRDEIKKILSQNL
ncbi:MAG: bifunctional nuclease family protein [Bacteroidetes bacterium]|nr:bifunctional nuclease family protein [Bacteroidota bacterium]